VRSARISEPQGFVEHIFLQALSSELVDSVKALKG